MSERLGLTATVSIALGGMIGGGIYAVLGVVTGVAGAATWASFALAGVVAGCAGYAYVALNDLADDRGGSVTLVQCFTGNTTLAGMTGWTLLVGYVGSMAMYAFAFAEFGIALPGVPEAVAGVPLRPPLSVAAVWGFVGLNLLGARATGTAETVLVAGKVGILVAFGLAGVAYALTDAAVALEFGTGGLLEAGPIVGAAVSFVAFQGWQLLFYDQGRVADPERTIPRAVAVSIPAAVAVYVLVGVATYALAPQALQRHPHTALATAAETVAAVVGPSGVGGFLVAVSALFSTGSAINATLFSAGHFAKGMLDDELLPDRVGDASADGVPTRTLLALGAVTSALTVAGTLGAITNFASVAFIVVFGGVSALALRRRDEPTVHPVPPAVGVLGTLAFLPLLLAHLYGSSPGTFWTVAVLAVAAITAEVLYFERDVLAEEVAAFESELEALDAPSRE